ATAPTGMWVQSTLEKPGSMHTYVGGGLCNGKMYGKPLVMTFVLMPPLELHPEGDDPTSHPTRLQAPAARACVVQRLRNPHWLSFVLSLYQKLQGVPCVGCPAPQAPCTR